MHVDVPDSPQSHVTFPQIVHLVHASGFLDSSDYDNLGRANPVFGKGTLVLEFPVSRPWAPNRKRRWGFGKARSDRYCTHDAINPKSILHFTWGFMSSQDRMSAIKTCPEWKLYASLRKHASTSSVAYLKAPRVLPVSGKLPERLDLRRAKDNTSCLLRFDFIHGDVIRYLGGEYVNRGRDFNSEWDIISRTLHRRKIPKEYPPVHFNLAYRLQTEGAPLKAQYTTPMSAPPLRERYDNHPAVSDNMDKVEQKFAKEEWKAYHLHYLRFVCVFIYGLVVNPIQWVYDKGKGRICIDCTNGPGDEQGSINTHIPKPKDDKVVLAQREIQCPPVHYQYAFKRFLRRVYRMRNALPRAPIMVHADDIEAAFRRVLYHPDAAAAFAYVFSDYLIIPVGQVFGSRNAPSFYCVMADLREVLAACRINVSPEELHDLVKRCTFSVDESSPLTTVPRDSHHPLLSEAELWSTYNSSYVDDNAVAAFRKTIAQAIHHSVSSAFEVFGHDFRRGHCLQAEKWHSEVSESFMYLGFRIDTHDMTVSWPYYKRERLHTLLLDVMARRPRYVTPKEMAKIVGVVRSASEIAPYGDFLSFNLQNALTMAAKNAFSNKRKWWTRSRIYLSSVAMNTIQQLMATLLEPEDSPLWSRPIALYLDRDFTHQVYSDASFGGIGGWSADFGYLWRIARETLVEAGFDMRPIVISSEDSEVDGLHINPLEYIGELINLWITIKCVMDRGPIDGGYIIGLLGDNKTALSWMSTAARTKDPLLQGLARLGAAMLVVASSLLMKSCPTHYPGKLNVVADDLSRPQVQGNPLGNSWPPLSPGGRNYRLVAYASCLSRCCK